VVSEAERARKERESLARKYAAVFGNPEGQNVLAHFSSDATLEALSGCAASADGVRYAASRLEKEGMHKLIIHILKQTAEGQRLAAGEEPPEPPKVSTKKQTHE